MEGESDTCFCSHKSFKHLNNASNKNYNSEQDIVHNSGTESTSTCELNTSFKI